MEKMIKRGTKFKQVSHLCPLLKLSYQQQLCNFQEERSVIRYKLFEVNEHFQVSSSVYSGVVVIFKRVLNLLLILLLIGRTESISRVDLVVIESAQQSTASRPIESTEGMKITNHQLDHQALLLGNLTKVHAQTTTTTSSTGSDNNSPVNKIINYREEDGDWKETSIAREEVGVKDGEDESEDATSDAIKASKQLKKLLLRPRQILSSFVPQTLTKQLVIKRPENLMTLNFKRIHEKLHNGGQSKVKTLNYPPLKQLRILHHQQQPRDQVAADFFALQATMGFRPELVSLDTDKNLLPNNPRQIVVVNKLQPAILTNPHHHQLQHHPHRQTTHHQPPQTPQSRFMIDGRQLTGQQLQRLRLQQQQRNQVPPAISSADFEEAAATAGEQFSAERDLDQIDQLIKSEYESRMNLNEQILQNQQQQQQLLVSYVRNNSKSPMKMPHRYQGSYAEKPLQMSEGAGHELLPDGQVSDDLELVLEDPKTSTWPPAPRLPAFPGKLSVDMKQSGDSSTRSPSQSSSLSSSDSWIPTTEFPPSRASAKVKKNHTLLAYDSNKLFAVNLSPSTESERKLSPPRGFSKPLEPFVPTALETIAQLRMNNSTAHNNNNNNNHNNGQQRANQWHASKVSEPMRADDNKTLLPSSSGLIRVQESSLEQIQMQKKVPTTTMLATRQQQQMDNPSQESSSFIHTTTASVAAPALPKQAIPIGGANLIRGQVDEREQSDFHTSTKHLHPLIHRHPALSGDGVSSSDSSIGESLHPQQQQQQQQALHLAQLMLDQRQRQQHRNTLVVPEPIEQFMTALSPQDDYLERDKDLTHVTTGGQSHDHHHHQRQQQQRQHHSPTLKEQVNGQQQLVASISLDETLRRLKETRAKIGQLQAELSNSTASIPSIKRQQLFTQQPANSSRWLGTTSDDSENDSSASSSYDDDDTFTTNSNNTGNHTSSSSSSASVAAGKHLFPEAPTTRVTNLDWFRVIPSLGNRTASTITRAQNSLNLPLGMYHNGPLTAPARLVASAFGQTARERLQPGPGWPAPPFTSPLPGSIFEEGVAAGERASGGPVVVMSTLSVEHDGSEGNPDTKASLSSGVIQPSLVIGNSKADSFKPLFEMPAAAGAAAIPVEGGRAEFKQEREEGNKKEAAGFNNSSSLSTAATTMTTATGDHDQLTPLINTTNTPVSNHKRFPTSLAAATAASDNGNNNNNHPLDADEDMPAKGEVGGEKGIRNANWAQKPLSQASGLLVVPSQRYKDRVELDKEQHSARPPLTPWKGSEAISMLPAFKLQPSSMDNSWKPTSGQHQQSSDSSESNGAESNNEAQAQRVGATIQTAEKRSSLGQQLFGKLINDSSTLTAPEFYHTRSSGNSTSHGQRKQEQSSNGKLTTERVLHTLIAFSCSVALICLIVIVALVRFQIRRQAKSRQSEVLMGGTGALVEGSSTSSVSEQSVRAPGGNSGKSNKSQVSSNSDRNQHDKLILDGTMRNVSLLARQHHQGVDRATTTLSGKKRKKIKMKTKVKKWPQQINLSNKHEDSITQLAGGAGSNTNSATSSSSLNNNMPLPMLNRSCCHCVTCSESWLFRESPPPQAANLDGSPTKQSGRSLCSSGFYHPAPRGKLPFGAASSVNKFLSSHHPSSSLQAGKNKRILTDNCSKQPLASQTRARPNCNSNNPVPGEPDDFSLNIQQQQQLDTFAIKGSRAPVGGTRLRMMSAIDERGFSTSPLEDLDTQAHQLQSTSDSTNLLLVQTNSQNFSACTEEHSIQCTCRGAGMLNSDSKHCYSHSCGHHHHQELHQEDNESCLSESRDAVDTSNSLLRTVLPSKVSDTCNSTLTNGENAECNCDQQLGPEDAFHEHQQTASFDPTKSCCVKSSSINETSAKILANCENNTSGANSREPNHNNSKLHQASSKKGLDRNLFQHKQQQHVNDDDALESFPDPPVKPLPLRIGVKKSLITVDTTLNNNSGIHNNNPIQGDNLDIHKMKLKSQNHEETARH